MGLDMYLEKEIYLGGYYTNHTILPFTNKYNNNIIQIDLNDKTIHKIVFEVLYWRKANAIHKWFVDNVQNGTDDCSRYWVDKEKLEQLLNVCKQVLEIYENNNLSPEEKEEKISSLLPTQKGFFFGTYDYDDWYITDIKETIAVLEEEIKSSDFKNNEYSYYYQSSW